MLYRDACRMDLLNAFTVRHGVFLKGRIMTLCFSLVLTGQEDNIAEYYQQQVEMLEGFNEMDTLTDRGFVPGMSKVLIASSLCIRPTICFFSRCIILILLYNLMT